MKMEICRGQGSGFQVQGSRFKVPGSRFRVYGKWWKSIEKHNKMEVWDGGEAKKYWKSLRKWRPWRKVQGSKFRVQVQGSSSFWTKNIKEVLKNIWKRKFGEVKVQGSRFKVQGSRFQVRGSGFIKNIEKLSKNVIKWRSGKGAKRKSIEKA